VLTGVKHQQPDSALKCSGNRLTHCLGRLLNNAQYRGDRIGHSGSISDRGQLEHPYPSTNSLATWVATSNASRVLPTPPTPVNVTSRRERTAASTSDTSVSRP